MLPYQILPDAGSVISTCRAAQGHGSGLGFCFQLMYGGQLLAAHVSDACAANKKHVLQFFQVCAHDFKPNLSGCI